MNLLPWFSLTRWRFWRPYSSGQTLRNLSYVRVTAGEFIGSSIECESVGRLVRVLTDAVIGGQQGRVKARAFQRNSG